MPSNKYRIPKLSKSVTLSQPISTLAVHKAEPTLRKQQDRFPKSIPTAKTRRNSSFHPRKIELEFSPPRTEDLDTRIQRLAGTDLSLW
jgi:hypothetical protein